MSDFVSEIEISRIFKEFDKTEQPLLMPLVTCWQVCFLCIAVGVTD